MKKRNVNDERDQNVMDSVIQNMTDFQKRKGKEGWFVLDSEMCFENIYKAAHDKDFNHYCKKGCRASKEPLEEIKYESLNNSKTV